MFLVRQKKGKFICQIYEINMTKKKHSSLTETHAAVILDSILDGVFTVDRDLKITYFNQAAEKITRVARQEAMGQYCFEVLRSNRCESGCPFKKLPNSQINKLNLNVNILRADGKQIPISVSATSLKDEDGNILGGVETFRDLSALETLRKEIKQNYTFEDIISKNYKMLQLFSIMPNIAESNCTVLLQGPSGSGKELFARAVHNLSHRNNNPFIAVNCGALPDNLLESELFGYVKGAFTDAKKDKPGRFALAHGGTIFLDEVESLSPATQVKLLRVLQEKEYEPLGATKTEKSNVRVISASKVDLYNLVEEEKFRDDLFFRLNIVKIELPSLAERSDDIPLLVNHFIEKFNHKKGKYISKASNEVIELLMNYSFPGNVRELENIIEHAFVMCTNEEIKLKHLPPELLGFHRKVNSHINVPLPLQITERQTILEALNKYNWNKLETAKELKLNRSTLWRKIKKYGLTK